MHVSARVPSALPPIRAIREANTAKIEDRNDLHFPVREITVHVSQADLFRAVLAAVFVDSGFNMSAPGAVIVASMGNIIPPACPSISFDSSSMPPPPASPTTGADPQPLSPSGQLPSGQQLKVPPPASEPPEQVPASEQLDGSFWEATSAGADADAAEAEPPSDSPEPPPRPAPLCVPHFPGPTADDVKRNGKRQRMGSMEVTMVRLAVKGARISSYSRSAAHTLARLPVSPALKYDATPAQASGDSNKEIT